jgi:D-beta-D-heptose 7-phosphate kinase/D-beta-D-heptose 1-phosphate adenosyltransferase
MTTESTVSELIKRFKSCHLLVIGDVMLDEYIWGDVRRICPEAPVPVVEELRRSSVPGGAANVAVNAAALGVQVALGGVVGSDAQGNALRDILILSGVDTAGLQVDPQRHTTAKTRIIAHNQQVVRVDREDTRPVSSALEHEMLEWLRERMPSADVCVLSDYAKGVLSPALTSEVIAAARQRGQPVVVDPKGWDYRRYRGASVITPNLREARRTQFAFRCRNSSTIRLAVLMSPEILPGAVVIPTRNRPAALRRTLASLAAQNAQPALVTIVDASDDSATRSLLLGQAIPGLASDVCWQASEAAGAAHQRNQGVRGCSQTVSLLRWSAWSG